MYKDRNSFLCTKKVREPTNHNTAADAAADLVTSLLAVTNEPVHIVLALEMSRGVKMSPQIAFGHQMSPLYSLSRSPLLWASFPLSCFHLFFTPPLLACFRLNLRSLPFPCPPIALPGFLVFFLPSQKGNIKVSLLASQKPYSL